MEKLQRTRAGRFETFERRYEPIEAEDGSILHDWRSIPKDTEQHYVWTLVDCDGRLMLSPGYATVNYMGRVLCAKPWPDEEFTLPGYYY
jgi:hypothetical protein